MSARGFVKKFSTAFGLRSKRGGAYDDVLIAPSFTPLARDYAEIFNSFQPSSIPVLELDQGDDHCWSSKLDYGNVFGDGQIEWTQVFSLADGVRKTDDALSHSGGSDQSIALEECQNQYSFRRKDSISCDKITEEEKGCETTGQTKNMIESLSINVTDEIVTLKSAEVNTSDVAVEEFNRLSDETLTRKHSGSISPGGLSRYGTDEYIEIDVRSGTGTEFGLDMPISSGMSIDANSIISEEQAFEVISPSDFVLDFASLNATFIEQASLRRNVCEDPCDVPTSSSREDVKMPSLDEPFIRDSVIDDNVARACATPKILMENLNACSRNVIEKAEDCSYNSLQDVKFQVVNDLRQPLVSNHQINPSVAIAQESSGPAPQTHSQNDFDKLNAASEADTLSKIVVSRNAYSECNDRADLQNKVIFELTSKDFPGDTRVINLESQSSKTISSSAVQCSLGNVGPVLKNSSMLQSGGFAKRTDTSATDDHVLLSSDDEIDKNSEPGIYVSDVKRAIREAQVWIKIAKESNGVKGFMKPFVTKTFGQVKLVKEVRDSKVEKSPKFFELGQMTVPNNHRLSASRREYINPSSTSSEIKTSPINNDGDELAIEGTVFFVSDRQHEKADVMVEKIELASTVPYVTPFINISEEKLTIYDNKESLNPVPEKWDATMLDMNEAGQVGMTEEANCYEVPEIGETEIVVIPTDNHEALFNNFEAENACHQAMFLSGQGFMKGSFHANFGQSHAGGSAINIEINDLVSGIGHMMVHPKQHKGSNSDCQPNCIPCNGNTENVLTTLEEGNEKEILLDPYDRVFDSEDFLGYASAEENLASSDTEDEIIGKNSNLIAQYQISEIKDTIMQNLVAPKVISIREDVFAPSFSNLNEGLAVEESCDGEALPLQNSVTHVTKVTPTEMEVVGETDQKDGKQLQNTITHTMAEIFSKKSKNESVGKNTGVIVDVPMLNSVVHEIDDTSEYGMPLCFNSVHEYPRVENADGVEAMIGKNMVIPEENDVSMRDNEIGLSFDHSNGGLMVAGIDADTTWEFRKGVSEDKTPCILEYIKLEIEELESAPSVEFPSIVNYAHPRSGGSEVEPIRADTVSGNSVQLSNEKQETDGACFSDLDSRTQAKEELQTVGIKEAVIIEKSHKPGNIKSFINDQASLDAASQKDAFSLDTEHDTTEVEAGNSFCKPLSDIIANDVTVEEGINFCKPLSDILMNDETTEFESQGDNRIFKPVDSVLEPGKQFCEPLPDTIESRSTCEFEKQGGNFVQLLERHERKKWEVPKESFELPESKVGIFKIQCTMEKDTFEVKSQIDKHERKKWEIPVETFKLPFLGDNDILEEKEEVEGQDREQVAKLTEKPERKKWQLQKEAYVAPNLCGKAVGQISGQDGIVFVTASEEEMMMNVPTNLIQSEVTSQDYVIHNEMYAKEELIVPAKRVSPGFCVDNSEEYLTKKSLQEVKILDEEEQEKKLYETSDQLEAKVEEGESDKQGDCAKVYEDVNVKDEIKRTLGMLWKRIYKSKYDEGFEIMESGVHKEVFGRVADKDLNLNGPVELVESPKKHDDTAFLNFSGDSCRSNNNTEETSYLKQFEVSGSKEEFISTTSDSSKLQEDDKNSWVDKTFEQKHNNNAIDPASYSDNIQPANRLVSDGQAPKTDIFPSRVNEYGKTDCGIVCRFEDLLPDSSLAYDAENAQKLKLVLRDNESKEGEAIKTTSMGKALQENDGENYLENELDALLADGISPRTTTENEQQNMTSQRQDSISVLDSRAADGMPSREPKLSDNKEFGPGRSSWKERLREEGESRDECIKQDKASEIHISSKEKADFIKVVGEINMSQLTVKEILNDQEPSKVEERTKEGLHKEVTPNLDVLQNIIRAIAVERAIHEVRERAFSVARERAVMESAKAEAQQKIAASNQEKIERALLETTLAAEESFLESTRKAELELTAVERATAEAREWALEKALSQKDQTYQSSSSGLGSASNYQCGSTSEDRLNDGNSSESALRFKATNGRHQQIAERASKAIDEKNTRDLLVQREQAERNRLAEVLDAEVKRWENGKTGNLRALLSTLQYVLGPDSGWNPIHLTDIVTPDALKKAYRKATLFVHPDKLQQRGATIKQKYICEKVFDLLKEAWKRVD